MALPFMVLTSPALALVGIQSTNRPVVLDFTDFQQSSVHLLHNRVRINLFNNSYSSTKRYFLFSYSCVFYRLYRNPYLWFFWKYSTELCGVKISKDVKIFITIQYNTSNVQYSYIKCMILMYNSKLCYYTKSNRGYQKKYLLWT